MKRARCVVNMELHREVADAKAELQTALGPAYSRTRRRHGSEESVTFEDEARRYAEREPKLAELLARFQAAVNAAWEDAAPLAPIALGRWVKTRRPHGGIQDAADMLAAAHWGLRAKIVSGCTSAFDPTLSPELYAWRLIQAMCGALDREHVRLAVPAEVPEEVRRDPRFVRGAADLRVPGEPAHSPGENSDE